MCIHFLEGMYVKEKVVIITGGSSGMGKGMANRFAKEGARVVITGRTKEKLEETKLEIEQFPGQVYLYKWMYEIRMIFKR